MDTAASIPEEDRLKQERRQNLQEMLRELGLSTEYWLPKLKEQLGVTCAQALQNLGKEDLLKLKSQAQHSWEKRALEKLLNLSHSCRLSKVQEYQKHNQQQAQQALRELEDLMSQGKKRQEEAVREKEAELRQAMGIPREYWPPPETSLREIIENMQKQFNHIEGTLYDRQNLPEEDLVRKASGGLALQGIYKTSQHRDLIEKREELLSLPEDFSLFGPEKGSWMETKEFSSSHAESVFIQTIQKLGFSATTSAKGEGWGFSVEAGRDHSQHSESQGSQQSHSEHSYFCTTKFSYIPLASCHFPINQLQFSKAALQELKCIEKLLGKAKGPDKLLLLRQRTEDIFHRFGSHANKGPVQLGGIYWWKAVAEDFRSGQLAEVKQQSAKALDIYMRGSYSSFGRKIAAGMNISNSHLKMTSQSTKFKNLQTKVQLLVGHTGGPPEQDNLPEWKAGLIASNQTWCVIDRGLQLIPIWDIILSNHRSDFEDPYQVAKCLRDNYTALTGLDAHIQDGKEILSANKDAQVFLEDVKYWEVSDPEKQLKKLIDFMQVLSQKVRSYDIWINICLTEGNLQNFLVNTVNFCKESSIHCIEFIKCQLRMLLYPHIYKVEHFPQVHTIMQWIFQTESHQEQVNISQLSEFIKILKDTQNVLMEKKAKSESQEALEDAQRKATYEISLSLHSFLENLQKTEQPDTQLLLLLIATGAGYDMVHNTFQYLLGYDELEYLHHEMQKAHDKYHELKDTCNYRAQAFLVLTGLTVTVGITAVPPEMKTQRLELMTHHMGQFLSEEIVKLITKFGAGHDWKNIENDLRLLIDGNYEAFVSSFQTEEVRKQLESLFLCHEKKQPQKTDDNEDNNTKVIEHGAFLELLQRLGLEHYYPKRMSRANFHLIHKASVYNTQPNSEQDLPFYFLQKLLVLDYKLRFLVFKGDENPEIPLSSSTSNKESEFFDPYGDIFEHSDSSSNTSVINPRRNIHPMDIQMAIHHCADDFARQYIYAKLSICQFALPLVVPHPCTSEIEFSLWALSQIRRSWQQSSTSSKVKNNYKNQQMTSVPTSIVSFIRVGNGFSTSKSQIMNSLVSEHKHDVFFHRHCPGSSTDCLLMKGVVEICWFCPGGEEKDRFDNCLTFTNLHGDAKEHGRQLTFLQKISSLIVVLMSASDNNEENRKVVRDLCQSSKPLICLLDDKEKTMVNNSSQKVVIGIKNRNEAELTEELTNTIRRLSDLSDTALNLEDCAHIAQKQGFQIDEDLRDCKEAKEKAQTLIALLEEMKLSKIKENLLPLQGQLWHLWCKKDKEFYHLREKGNRSIEQHKSDIETEKQRIRRQQLDKAFPLNDLMRSFLEILQERSEPLTKLYFLQWLSVLLTNRSIKPLENLHEQQRTLWSSIQTEKQTVLKSNSLGDKQNKIEAISKEISDCSLGVEHLLREIGQIYEALEEVSSIRDPLFLCLPHIAADLMIAGAPMELMDGDASYVPLKWVAAIFDKLSEKLGDKRLFVLSILGLQSSGKSTLLNALFGLQFTVSAGRCTRGAYMQLLKVEETFTEELGFDFMLVVDTEGLRAPELNNKSQNWDNELATFIIGLGNLTLINIFGENPSEMQDILQIVVQAFLRMKQVRLSPSCLFVHQNVGEVTAKDQTMEARRRLEQRLDEMAAIAAEQEQCPHVTRFSDVIKFDVSNHLYYFAHLWDGNPPMAPPNPRYSYNVQELKSNILMTAKEESRGTIMRLSEVKLRVQDLWKALINENFIFSFRNTKEVMAMSKLETMYNHWSWELRSHVLDLQNTLTNQIQNFKMQTLKPNTVEASVKEKYGTIKIDLEKYFTEDPDYEILVQWKANFENKLEILKEALISESQRKAEELIYLKKSQEKLSAKKTSYEKELLEKSRKLALTVQDKELSEEELNKKFNYLWKEWVCEVASASPPAKEPDIDVDSENTLLNYFTQEIHMRDRLKSNCREHFQIDYDKHIKMGKTCLEFKKSLEVHDKEHINKTTDSIISNFNEIIDNIRRQKCDYNPSYFYEILRMIDKEMASASTDNRYTFTNKYKIDLALCLFQRAKENFKEIHKAFKRANDPVNYLESKKDDFFMSFKISCQGVTSIKSFVDFLWNKLTFAISTTILDKMVLKVSGHMRATCPAFNGNRANLEKHILTSLAEEEIFHSYWQYLTSPKLFFEDYIEHHIQRYYLDKTCEKTKTFLKISVDEIKTVILEAIHESTAVAKDKSSTASEWLDLFCDHLGSNLVFPRSTLVSIEHQEIKDTEFLKQAMSEALDPTLKRVEQDFLNVSIKKLAPETTKLLSEHLCGCWKQCPCCKAICTNTIPTHEGDHRVPFHRPQAVSGMTWDKTDHFTIDCCTSLVASDCLLVLSDDRKIPYKNYRQAGGDYATWSITPDSTTQPYWKWFICHFRTELEKMYEKKFEGKGQIPDAWTKITKQEVLDDLKRQ
ncbi:PREDICTED: interferon-induced very large GTPase 1-like [Chrysochloris asiatica]|uniref:Interferon-induced very large GTPase 1-like n=1 Tax=Chrysochloris asiatica TaxID=185453 RepID=A0A9B0TT38_CHRAS|nr:PREDICTED: interferon-induced very large GTPase 1-like [Chrysochloris asiatica]